MRFRKGFTLIELLVVIAIIAILAAILFPVFMRAKTTANTQKCMSHGRELGLAMTMYLDDNAGRFPSSATAEMLAKYSNVTWRYAWPGNPKTSDPSFHWGVGGMNQFAYIQLAPYVKNTQIWICPAPMTVHSMKYAYGYRNSWFFRTSNLGKGSYPDTPFQDDKGIGRTVSEVAGKDQGDFHRNVPPSKKFFAWCYTLGDDYLIEAYSGGPVITPSYAHDEGSVYVFLDGHARYRDTGCGFAPVGYTNDRLDRPHKRKS